MSNTLQTKNLLGPPAILAAAIGATDTSCTVSDATKFPVLTAGQYFPMSLQDTSTSPIEIVNVTATNGTTFTITRGVEGSTASAHITGAQCLSGLTEDMFSTVKNSGSVFIDTGNIAAWPNKNLAILEIAKTVAAATTVTIDPTLLIPFKPYAVVDGSQNCQANNITLIAASGNINGSPSFVMNINGQSVFFYSNGTSLRILA